MLPQSTERCHGIVPSAEPRIVFLNALRLPENKATAGALTS